MSNDSKSCFDSSQLPSKIMKLSEEIIIKSCSENSNDQNVKFIDIHQLIVQIKDSLKSMPASKLEILFEKLLGYESNRRPLSSTRFKAIFSAWAAKLIETCHSDFTIWKDLFPHEKSDNNQDDDNIDNDIKKIDIDERNIDDLQVTMLVDQPKRSNFNQYGTFVHDQDEISDNIQSIDDYSLNISSQNVSRQSLPFPLETSSHSSHKYQQNNVELNHLRQKIDNRDRIITNLQSKNLEMLKFKVESHNLSTKILELENKIKTLKDEILQFQKKKQEVECRLKETNNMLSKSIAKCDNLNQVLKNCTKERDNMQQENVQLQYMVQSSDLENSMMKEQLSSLKLNNEILSEKVASLTCSGEFSLNYNNNLIGNEKSHFTNKSFCSSNCSKADKSYQEKLNKISDIAKDLQNMNKSNASLIVDLRDELLTTTENFKRLQNTKLSGLKNQINGFLDLTMNSVCIFHNQIKMAQLQYNNSTKKSDDNSKINIKLCAYARNIKYKISKNMIFVRIVIFCCISIILLYFACNMVKYGSLMGIQEAKGIKENFFYFYYYM